MPGMYGNDFDLVGIITGIVEKSEIITGEHIAPGDVAVGLASNGLHTNGFSLARKLLFEAAGYTVKSTPAELGGESVGEALLKPHTCYLPAIKAAKAADVTINGIAHITGGGLVDNVPRILPKTVDAVFHTAKIPFRSAIFDLMVKIGSLPVQEAYRVFNMGVGMVWFVRPDAVKTAIDAAESAGIRAFAVGEVAEGSGKSIVTE